MPIRKHSGETLTKRNYNVELRASEEETGVIEGTPIVFNQKTRIQDWAGEYDEIIDAHALDNCDLKDVRLFVNHDINKITLARSRKGNDNSTMNFTIDGEGLHIKAKLDTENNSEARALHSAVRRGDMDGMSFMFRIKSDEWRDIDSDVPTRLVKEISIVHEVSVVNFPAYPQTSVNARSNSQESETSPLEEARKAFSQESDRRKKEALELEMTRYSYLSKLGGNRK